ncbi:MAG: glycerophosphodiester phosphodiesterase, partial [Candidatus Saccharimonadales bacterium]
MKIMGHRGAAGLELENSAAGIEKAIELGVDFIEIDVRKTHDNQLILCHDDNFGR